MLTTNILSIYLEHYGMCLDIAAISYQKETQ